MLESETMPPYLTPKPPMATIPQARAGIIARDEMR